MKRLYKKALIDLQADDLRVKKIDTDVEDEEALLNDPELDFLDHMDNKKEDILEIKPSIEDLIDEKPKFEQPLVTTEDVNNEFAVESPGMGIELVSLEQGLLHDLASLQVMYQQTKLFHWIFNGENYISTHRFLNEVAEAISEEVDLFAERLVFLNIDPVADMTQITTLSYVEFVQMNQSFKFGSLMMVLDTGLTKIVDSMKDNSIRASESKDIGTSKMLEDFIYDLEVLQHHIRSFK